jgi:signal transduction histidine kinase/ActR/RegA family two-component response regulator
LLLCWFVSAAAHELGLPPLVNYPARLHERADVTWVAAQDSRGRMFFGNFSVTLLFDGAEWTEVEMPFARNIRAFAMGADDTLFVGAYNQFGFIRESPRGHWDFTSLVPHLAEAERDFRDIEAVVIDGNEVRFATTRRVFTWDGARLTTLAHDAGRPFAVGTDLFFHRVGFPLQKLVAGQFQTIARGDALTNDAVTFVAPGATGGLVVGTARSGLYHVVDETLRPWRTDADATLRAAGIGTGTLLPDHACAVSLQSGGLLLLDPEGRLLTRLDESAGLANAFVRHVFADREGGLWLSTGDGVTRVQWPAHVSRFDARNGLGRAGIAGIVRHEGALYVATHLGIHRLKPARGDTPATFEEVPGPRGSPPLLPRPDGLYSADRSGLFRLESGGFVRVLPFSRPAPGLVRLARSATVPDRVWVLRGDGLASVRRDGDRWIEEEPVTGVNVPLVGGVEEPDGTIWATKQFDGFLRVRFARDPQRPPEVQEFSGGRGLPAKLAANNWVSLWRGRALFATDYGAYQFDAARGEFRPLEDMGAALNQPPLVISSLYGPDPERLWLTAFTTPPGRGADRGKRTFELAGPSRWQQLPGYVNHARGTASRSAHYEEIDSLGRRVWWTAGSAGLVRVELPGAFLGPPDFRAEIYGETLTGGHAWPAKARTDATDPRTAPRPAPERSAPAPRLLQDGDRLAPTETSVRFRFVAAVHRPEAAIEYQSKLEGLEAEWSPWSAERTRSFTRLPAGAYRFHVRVRDADGRIGSDATLAFVLAEPWWSRWWALALWLACGAATLVGLIQWRNRALQRRNERLEQLVAERTADLRQREAQLREARDAADSANRAKSTFLASMSHELRTPLNAVLGYAQLLRQNPGLPPDAPRQLETIRQSGEHLLQVINEVLDLAKIEAGRVELRPAPFSLPRLLAHLSEVFSLRAGQKDLTFASRTSGTLPPWVEGDEARLRQVLYNLLGNALKFTDAGGVELRVDAEEGRIRFSVADTGIGIAPADQARIFGLFQQAGGSRAAQGAGLGLAISQRLVQLMGGTIAVESAVGVGSRFSFALELPPAGPATSERDPAPPTGYRGPRRRVLIVDDELVNREFLRAALAPLGFEVVEAGDGPGALAAARRERPDLLLVDLRLPGCDGLEVTRRLRVDPALAAIKVVAVSASVFPDDRAQALAAGCDDFCAKPIQVPRLLESIASCLAIEWVRSEARTGPAEPDELPANWSVVDGSALDELEALAEIGDLVPLRARVAALRRVQPAADDFLRMIDQIAARADLVSLRAWLGRARRP